MSVPKFAPGTGCTPDVDYCSESGAHALAAKIRKAWAQVGRIAETEVFVVIPGDPAKPHSRATYGVRVGNMVNGLVP